MRSKTSFPSIRWTILHFIALGAGFLLTSCVAGQLCRIATRPDFQEQRESDGRGP